MARALRGSGRGSILMAPPSSRASTSSCSTSWSAPFGPFTFTVWPSTPAVTPDGTATAFLPMRDIAFSRLEHRAQDFAADVGLARVVIGHHALRGRHDGDPEAVVDARQIPDRGVHAAARLRHPRNVADHRRAVEILQLDLELGAAVRVFGGGIAADVTLVLEHLQHARAQARTGRRDLRLAAHLRVADAGEEIAERIVQSHASPPSPARLEEAWDEALRAEIAQCDAAHPELAVKGARPSGHLAAVANARLRGIARHLRELERGGKALLHGERLVVCDLLKPRAPAGILLGELAPPVVLLDRTLLRHLGLLGVRV